VADYLKLENRFRMLSKSRPEDAKHLFEQAQENVTARWQLYQQLTRTGGASLATSVNQKATK
jgi:hypothetical protein